LSVHSGPRYTGPSLSTTSVLADGDAEGRPSFNALQNYGSTGSSLHFFIFDGLVLKGKDVTGAQLVKPRALIEEHVLPTVFSVANLPALG
jgi:ATP-dependent DNA ligase